MNYSLCVVFYCRINTTEKISTNTTGREYEEVKHMNKENSVINLDSSVKCEDLNSSVKCEGMAMSDCVAYGELHSPNTPENTKNNVYEIVQ